VVNGTYEFQGYNVYQFPSRTSTLADGKKLATYDVVDEVTVVLDDQFDQASGQILSLPVQQGSNSGIKRFQGFAEDAITGKPTLNNGQEYYFAVTAYSLSTDPFATPRTLESTPNILTVIPQSPPPGFRYEAAFGDTATSTHTTGPGDGSMFAIIVDPTKLTGHQYKVTFATVDDEPIWNLTDVTTGQAKLSNQTNQSGDDNYTIVDGMLIKVTGPPPGMKDWDIPSGTRRFTFAGGAAGFEFEGFFGAIGWASPNQVFGGGPPGVEAPFIKNTLLTLATVATDGTYDPLDPNVSYGYRYGRGFASPAAKPEFAPFIINPSGGYSFQDFTKSVPLSAWDVEASPPRRLAVGHLENNQPGGLVDGKWFPGDFNVYDNTAGSGPREWLWIFLADYSETPNPAYEVEATGNPLPVMWWLTVARRGNVAFSPGGTGEDEFLILANHVNSALDEFVLDAPAAQFNTDVAKSDVERIKVFPNPYYGSNLAETNRFIRFVTFNFLPAKATVRIFNVAGQLVRQLEKDDATQFLRWDLNNASNFPVASGMYIAHIDMPDIGATKVVKFAIIQEQEILDIF